MAKNEEQLAILNPNPIQLSGPTLLHELVPDSEDEQHVAIEFCDDKKSKHSLTYHELHKKSDALAARITNALGRASSRTPHPIVPLLLPQCPELYITQLAILKAGSAFCPLPIDAPEERLRFILHDTSAKVVITTSRLSGRIARQDDIAIINVDEQNDSARISKNVNSAKSTDLAYVMYTSGSTGLPKGVLLSHRAATQALIAHDEHIPAYSRFLQVAAPTFDVSVFEIFFTLFRGSTLVCCDRTQLLSDLPGTINTLRIDAVELTPSVASNLLGARENVPGLKVLLTIGEMLKKDVVESYGGTEPSDAILYGMYGPTEATIHCTLQPSFLKRMPVGNVGIPLATVSTFIVSTIENTPKDSPPSILAIGEEGELAVGGYQLADGYLNREEQTRAAFIDHPKYGRLYRTGDKAKIHQDGWIECLGRISAGQVKLRGQRMELGEVEYAVTKTEGCSGAVAEVISDTLVAFCLSTENVTEHDVFATCKKWLPAFMVPSEVILQSQLPYLPSGKIDRRLLRSEWEAKQQPDDINTSAQDQDTRTNRIVSVLKDILGPSVIRGQEMKITRIDSLTSIRVASAIRKLGYPQPSATEIMEVETVKDIVQVLDSTSSRQSLATDSSAVLIEQRREYALLHPLISAHRNDVEMILPCSAVQSAMLAETSISPQNYCNWLKFEVNSQDDNNIEQSIDKLFQAYQMLRAGFLATDDLASSYSLLIWKDRSSEQVSWVKDISPDYTLTNEQDLLRACTVQLCKQDKSVQILLRLHHALYDQWSIDLFQRDMQHLLDGGELDSPPYSFVLEHYIDNIDAAVSTEALDYWHQKLHTAEPVAFPNLNSIRSEASQARTGWQPLLIDIDLLNQANKKHGWTSQAVFQAAFAYLLRVYTGTSEPIYGTVFSGRQIALASIENIFGPTLTTLPMKASIKSEQTCSELIDAIVASTRETLKYSETPLSQIRRIASLSLDQTLFDTLFVWQETILDEAHHPQISLIDSADYHEFKLALELHPTQQGIEVRLTYDESIIPAIQAQRYIAQLEHTVRIFVEQADLSIGKVSYPPPLLSISNPAPIEAAKDLDLIAELEKEAKNHDTAISFWSTNTETNNKVEHIRYIQLHGQANRLANHLVNLGLSANDLVCICMEKSIKFYTAILAVVKTGAGYLPIVPNTKSDRITAILQQANVKAVIADDIKQACFQDLHVPLVQTSALGQLNTSPNPPKVKSDPSDVAYAVFTSGSTGTPKGVVVTRQNLLGNIKVLQQLYKHKSGDRMLQACIQSFDVAVFEIFFSLLSGMRICSGTTEVMFEDLERFVRIADATHLSMTTTVAGLVNPANVPSVKFLVTSGEAMTGAVHKAWAGKGLHQGYGPSETTNICTVNLNMSSNHNLGAIGPPFKNTSAFVLDVENDHCILPQGAFGELAFGGEQVFRGYMNLPELNKEKILDLPGHGRVYRSGDLGRILADGSILIHGRLDFQVKIRGNRVELGEISSNILSCDFVEDCVTITDQHEQYGQILASFWVPKRVHTIELKIISPTEETLQQNAAVFDGLERRLPSYMMPTFVFPITRLPRTVQGKMDQRQLKAVLRSASTEQQTQYSNKWTSTDEEIDVRPAESEIIEVLTKLYKVNAEQLDRLLPFDTVGVNSVNAASFAKALRQKLSQDVSVSTILRNFSVARLARALDGNTIQSSTVARPKLNVFPSEVLQGVHKRFGHDAADIETILPCTPLQEAMLATSDEKSSAYCNITTLIVHGDIARLKSAFNQAFQRHEILRTKFVNTDQADRPFAQVVFKRIALPWSETQDNTAITPVNPINICISKSGKRTSLKISMHHATYDGTSMDILFSELEQFYREQQVASHVWPEAFLTECVKQSGAAAQDFWSKRLHGYQPKPFPKKSDTVLAREQRQKLPLQTKLSSIEAFCQEHSISYSSVLESTWAICLSILQDSKDICFGKVVNGRLPWIDGIDRLVAPCFNTIPVRVDLASPKSRLDLLQSLNRSKTTTAKYSLTPLRQMQRFSRDPASHLFDSLLLIQAASYTFDEAVWSLESDEGEMGFPLVLEIGHDEQHLELTTHFVTDVFDAATINAIAQLFDNVLASVLSNEKASLFEGTHDLNLRGILRSTKLNEESDASQDQDNDPAWSSEEAIVRDVLLSFSRAKPEAIRKQTTIYQLGLDSLNAAQIASRLRQNGYNVDLADIMEHRTPAGIAAAMSKKSSVGQAGSEAEQFHAFEKQHVESICEQLKLDIDDVESLRPCTVVQQGMLAQSLSSKGALYVNHIRMRLYRKVGSSTICKAWQMVQAKHPILRTGFVHTDAEEAAFAMITMKEQRKGCLKDKAYTEDGDEEETSEIEIASDIVQDLATPPWRVELFCKKDHIVMLLSIHHVLYDADGLRVIQKDLATACRGLQIGSPYLLDTILQPLEAARTASRQQQEQFWKQLLENTAFSKFPGLAPRVVSSPQPIQHESKSSLTAAKLRKLCKAQNCTIQAAGQAAWARLLSAYTGEPQVTFGTVFSSRSLVENDDVVFPCINTLPVSTTVNKRSTDLIHDMQDYNARLQRYRFTPLADIQRFAGRLTEALFDTVFVFQTSDQSGENVNDLQIIRQSAAVDFKVSLEMEILSSDEILFTLSTTDEVLPHEHAEMLLAQFDQLLQAELGSSTADDFDRHLLSICPAKQGTIPAPYILLHQVIKHSAEKYHDHPAIEFIPSLDSQERRSWSYQELDELSDRFAQQLLEHGAKAGGVVAVCMEKCPEASFAFASILKTGSAFLAMDPELPEARKKFILKDSGTSILLVNKFSDLLQLDTTAKVLAITMDQIEQLPGAKLTEPDIDPQAVCYCLYTSGSTGTPKGCEITHENAVEAMMSFQRLFKGHWKTTSRWLQFASYWFDVSVLEHFWSWSVGITMVGAPRDLVLSDLVYFINEANITHIDLTPSLARLLEPEDVPCLCDGVFITGGEALKQEIIRKWGQHGVICNGYGPTEATIGVTMNKFISTDARSDNIGPPFDNVGSFVLDEDDKPVLRGAIGELCVFGKLVGKGYLNQPELTAKMFPTIDHLGERIYRTGDLVRQLTDNSFLFIGRKDTQAKLRGQRLEIGEIDSVVKGTDSSITDVSSLVIKSEDGNKQTLVSFFTTASTSKIKEALLDVSDRTSALVSSIRTSCENYLAGYMVPTHIIPLQSLPLTVNNKVDVKKLGAMYNKISAQDFASIQGGDGAVEALDEDGQQLANILADMLALEADDITSTTNIFSLGVSSITAIQLVRRLQHAGFKNARIDLVMKTPEVGQLAAALVSHANSNGDIDDSIKHAKLHLHAFDQRFRRLAASKLSQPFVDLEYVAPCTALQQGLLIESINNAEKPYFNAFQLQLQQVDIEKLQASWQILANTIQILRTKFVETDEGHIQAILKSQRVTVHHLECSSTNLEDTLAEAKDAWIKSNEKNMFEPFEVLLIESGSTNMMVIHVHHALYDGISFDLLLNALAEAYRGVSVKQAISFTEVLPYGPLRKAKDAKVYWSKRLSHFSHQPLPRSNKTGSSTTIVHQVKYEDGFVDLARKSIGISHQAVVQIAFEAAIAQILNTTTTYGMVVSGRSLSVDGADQVIGPLFNTLPTAFHILQQDSWSQAAKRCHERNTSSIPYHHTALRDIKKWINVPSNKDMFDVLFVFQMTDQSSHERHDHPWQVVDTGYRADYPMSFEAELTVDGRLTITVVAQSAFADDGLLQDLTARFTESLELMAKGNDKLIVDTVPHLKASSATREDSGPQQASTPNVNGVANFKWTKEAEVLRSGIATLLGVPSSRVDEHSSIFELGLDSIDAVKLASRLKKQKVMLSVSSILKAQTIPRMIAAVQHDQARPQQSQQKLAKLEQFLRDSVGINKSDVERIIPATPNQEGLLALMIQSDFEEYFNHDLLEVNADVDISKLEQTWRNVISQTPILRTSFREVLQAEINCSFAQVIHKTVDLDIRRVKVSNNVELRSLMEDIRTDVSETIANRPPLCLTFIAMDGKQYLLLSMAHALYDGHSLALLHANIESVYHGRQIAMPSSDTAIETAIQANNNESVQFWAGTMASIDKRRFPTMNKDGHANRVNRAEFQSTMAGSEIRKQCRELGVSLQTLAQTTWSLLLAYYTKKLDVVFGSVLACRDTDEAEYIMFPMMNTVARRVTVFGSHKEMLQAVQEFNIELLPHKQTPLRLVQAAVTKQNPSQQNGEDRGLFDNLFIYQQRPNTIEPDDEPLYHSVQASSKVEYPVATEVEMVDDKLTIRTAVNDKILSRSSAQKLLRQYDSILQRLLINPDEPVISFSGDDISICGLPSIRLVSTVTSSNGDDSREVADTETNEDFKPSQEWQTIQEVLADVSGTAVKDIKPSSSLDSLGIDSISAIKVTSRLRQSSIRLKVSELLKVRTAGKIASLAQQGVSQSTASYRRSAEDLSWQVMLEDVMDKDKLDAANVEKILPATAGQAYMLSVWLNTNGRLFYPTFTYSLPVDVDLKIVKAAWRSLTQQHDVLRTVFVATTKKELPIAQVVLKKTPDNFVSEEQWPRHDLTRPMACLRATREDEGWRLDLKIHHALYDAISLPLLIQDLETLLDGGKLRTSEAQYQEYISQSLSQKAFTESKKFWCDYLESSRPAELTQDRQSKATKRVEMFQPELLPTITSTEELIRRNDLNLQSLFFAAWAKVYYKLACVQDDRTDVILGIYYSNRSHLDDMLELRDPTINLIPLRIKTPASKTLLELAREVQYDLKKCGSIERSAVALWQVAEWTDIKVDTFVNFLKLPESLERGRKDGEVRIQALDDRREVQRAALMDVDQSPGFDKPSELSNLPDWQHVYRDSLDVEMTVAHGSLDVGLFGLESLVDFSTAKQMLQELKKEILAALE